VGRTCGGGDIGRWERHTGERHTHGRDPPGPNKVSRMCRGGDIGRWARCTGERYTCREMRCVCTGETRLGPNEVSRTRRASRRQARWAGRKGERPTCGREGPTRSEQGGQDALEHIKQV